MNLKEGTRRLALLLGVAGAIFAMYVSYLEVQSVLDRRASHTKYQTLADSDAARRTLKEQTGWASIDPKTGERIQWDQQVNKEGIKTIHWTEDNQIEWIVAQDGQTLYPTPAPSAWEYTFVVMLPIAGFLVPLGIVHAIGWVCAGFVAGSKTGQQ